MKYTSGIIAVTIFALLVAGCSSSTPSSSPTAYRLNDVWGGVLNAGGTDFAVFAMDVTTTVNGSTGSVSGYGVMTDGVSDVYLTVTGSTSPGTVSLTFTDLGSDTIRVSGSVEGLVIRGTWTYPSLSISGSMRMARDENTELLLTTGRRTDARISNLF